MFRLKDALPTADLIASAPLVDLAGHLLSILAHRLQHSNDAETLGNFLGNLRNDYCEPGQGMPSDALQACAEAWEWLHAHRLICRHHSHGEHWCTLTRSGRAATGQAAFASWVAEQELPESMLHAELQGPALRLFRQGLLDNAVFEAFKTLEVNMREAADLGHDLVGMALASRAFNPEDGPLADLAVEKGERVALMQMMAGALGSYKNPHSHRRVSIAAGEAREMLLIASHLLRIVDSRRP